jgi:hypothetical protein
MQVSGVRDAPLARGSVPARNVEAYPVTTIPAGLTVNSTFTITFWASDGTTTQTESVPIVIKASCARRY